MKHHLLAACLLGPAMLLSHGALADPHEDDAVAQLIANRSQQGPKQALEIATVNYSGVITDFELDDKNDRIVYKITLVNLDKNSKTILFYDAETFDLVEEQADTLIGWFKDEDDQAQIQALEEIQSNGFSMIQALEIVQEKHPGFLVEAALESKKGIHFFEIKLASPEDKQKWLVDVSSRDLIPVYRR